MAHAARQTWKEKRDRLIRSDFVGRQEQLTTFRRSVTDDAAETMIFAISGQGGVGKTTLLKEFRKIATECGHIAAYVDEGSVTNRVDDVPEALWRLAKDFESQNSAYKFEKFQERYRMYRQKRQELEADPEAPSGIASGIGRVGTKFGFGLAKAIPGVGDAIGEFVDQDAIAEKGGDLLSFAWKKLRNQDEVQLVTEPLEVLTPLFLEEMNRIAAKQMVILLLDTYEVTGAFLDEWIRGVLNDRYGDDLTANFRLCIAGRDPLDRNAWVDLETCIARSPLEPFTEEEAWGFLRGKGILGEAVIEQIWRLSSGGLPLLVAMMAENAPTEPDAVVDPCELAVERFLKWETDGEKRILAQSGAMPRVLDADVVAVLGDGQFEWLKRCAFVIRDGGRWRYHTVVREQMLRYQLQRSRSQFSSVHGKLAAFYEKRRSALGLPLGKESEDQIWREYSLEWIYHIICAAPQMSVSLALNGFLMALNRSWEFAAGWAVAIVQAGKETEYMEIYQWGETLQNGVIAHNEKRYYDTAALFTKLIDSQLIELINKATAHSWRGYCFCNSEKSELGLRDLLRAVEIDKNDPWYQFNAASEYNKQGKQDEAILMYQNLVELNFDTSLKSRIYLILGHLFSSKNQHEQAILCCEKSIFLEPENPDSYKMIGSIFYSQKFIEKTIQSFEKVISLDPKNPEGYQYLGYVYFTQKCYTQAISNFEKVLLFQSDNEEKSIVNCLLGACFSIKGDFKKSAMFFEKTLSSNCGDTDVYRISEIFKLLQSIHKAQKNFEETLIVCEQKLQLDPENDYLHYWYAIYLTKLDRPTEAQTNLQSAIVLAQAKQVEDPADWQNNFNLALYYLTAGRFEESDGLYGRASEASRDSIEDAIQDLDNYLVLFPDDLRPTVGHRLQAREMRDRLSALV